MRRAHRALALVAALAPFGCDDHPSRPQVASSAVASSSPPTASASTLPSSSAPPAASASAAAGDASLEILKMTLTSGVKNRDPVDKLDAAGPGDRVYAHLRLRNRSDAEREVTLVFRVNGKTRTTKKLDVEPSWSFRTWGYNTLQDGDTRGELTVTVTDDDGATIAEASLPIHKNAR